MDNVNPETGIRYGIISGSGEDSYKLLEAIAERGKTADEMILPIISGKIIELLKEYEPINSVSEIEYLAETLVNQLKFTDEDCEEPQVEFYEDSDGNKFQLHYLGGCPTIYCIKTDKITHVRRLCSPCVPNAGDLDSGFHANGHECYGVPDKYLQDDNGN